MRIIGDKNGEWQTLTEWHDVVAWRTLAERAETTLTKGGMVYVEGKLTTRTWQDQDGNNRRTTEVVANYFRAINKRDGARPMNSQPGYIPSPDDEIPTNATFETPPSNTGFSSPGGEVPIVETGQSGSTPSADDDLPF